jgi:hypothetical protein
MRCPVTLVTSDYTRGLESEELALLLAFVVQDLCRACASDVDSEPALKHNRNAQSISILLYDCVSEIFFGAYVQL